jgi:hypothetical protein
MLSRNPHQRRPSLARRLITAATIATMQATAIILVGVFASWLIVNWLTGCGERFATAGGYVQGECVSITTLYSEE